MIFFLWLGRGWMWRRWRSLRLWNIQISLFSWYIQVQTVKWLGKWRRWPRNSLFMRTQAGTRTWWRCYIIVICMTRTDMICAPSLTSKSSWAPLPPKGTCKFQKTFHWRYLAKKEEIRCDGQSNEDNRGWKLWHWPTPRTSVNFPFHPQTFHFIL